MRFCRHYVGVLEITTPTDEKEHGNQIEIWVYLGVYMDLVYGSFLCFWWELFAP